MPVPSDTSARLALPYLAPSQAQKHVTHNEALLLLDSLVQLSVVEVDATVPPGDPAAGDIHALGSAAEGAWAGQDGKLAAWDGAAWHFLDPREGWRAYDLAAGRGVVFDGSAWQPEVSELQDLEGVGVNTGWDGVNRLSVAAQASLFSHDGAGGGHRVGIGGAGNPEVHELRLAVSVDHDVLRLQIAMDDTLAVRLPKALEHLSDPG